MEDKKTFVVQWIKTMDLRFLRVWQFNSAHVPQRSIHFETPEKDILQSDSDFYNMNRFGSLASAEWKKYLQCKSIALQQTAM